MQWAVDDQFCKDQAVTATAASADTIDLKKSRHLGTGMPLYLVVVCTEDMTDSGDDSTVTPSLEVDDNSGFSSAATPLTLGAFAALSKAGTVKYGVIPPDVDIEQYARVKFTVANGNLSTGKFTAFLTPNIHSWKAYADAALGPG